MALLKDIEQSSGVVVSYWKITSASFDFENQKCHVGLAGYLDADARTDNKVICANVGVSMDWSEANNVSRAELYPALKQDDQFAGAEDC